MLTLLIAASRGFMKALRPSQNIFEVPQKMWKQNIKLYFSLHPGSDQEGLSCSVTHKANLIGVLFYRQWRKTVFKSQKSQKFLGKIVAENCFVTNFKF